MLFLFRMPAIAVTLIWLSAPLLGRLGPFLFILLGALAYRRGPQRRIAGLAGLFGLALTYSAYTTLNATWTTPEGVSLFPSVREALHLFVPTGIAVLAFRMEDIPDWRVIFVGALGGCCTALGLGLLLQQIYALPQPEFLASNPLYLGASLLYPAVICLFPGREASLRWQILGYCAVLTVAISLAMITQSRAYFVLLLAIVFARILGATIERFGAIQAIIATTVATCLLLLSVLWLMPEAAKQRLFALGQIPATVQEMWQRDASGVPSAEQEAGGDASVRARVAMLVAATKAFGEAPLFGHGAPNKYSAAVPYMPDAYARTTNLFHLHNELANQAVAGGIIGLVLMLALVAYPVWHAWRMGVLYTWLGGFAALTALASFGIGFGNVLLMADYPAYLFAVNSIGAIMVITAGAKKSVG